jgi:peptidoglycan hydrolase-like protein with peptidoglycan-binding domain
MSVYPRDLASPDPWEASLNRSLARRSRRTRRRPAERLLTPPAVSPAAQPHRVHAAPVAIGARRRPGAARSAPVRARTEPLIARGGVTEEATELLAPAPPQEPVGGGRQAVLAAAVEEASALRARAAADGRDLADEELWELSLGRSRARRRAGELRFVPSGSRARRLSLGTVAALAVGPASNLGEASAAGHTGSATQPPPPATSTEHHILLVSGSTGYQVRKLQQALGVKVDGDFGAETEAAVYEFQATRGLEVDGVVGPQTSAALARQAPPVQVSKATAVKLAQAALHVQVDGEFGPETEQAIRRFQGAAHIKVDGVVGPETWHALHVDGEATLTPPPSALPQPHPSRPVEPESSEGHGEAEAEAENGASEGGRGHRGTAVAHTALVGEHQGPRHPSGSPVRVLQEALRISADGEYGPETAAAIKRFQSAHGLEVDGVVGPATWAALGISGEPIIYPPHPRPAAHSGGGGGGGGESSSGGEGVVARVIAAANEIATRPYVYGGGHGSFTSEGYDCSGSVSYALHGGGLLSSPEDSSELESYGEPGPGRYITIYANAEHAYMVIDGRRFDTVALAESGSRWSDSAGSDGGNFVVRHPAGL